MGKVFLLVVITYSSQPTVVYHMAAKNMAECFAQAAELAKGTPLSGDNVVKYAIGCSFEEPVPDEAL